MLELCILGFTVEGSLLRGFGCVSGFFGRVYPGRACMSFCREGGMEERVSEEENVSDRIASTSIASYHGTLA